MKSTYEEFKGQDGLLDSMLQTAIRMHIEDVEHNRQLSRYGAELIDDGDTILTHCNAGALATGGYGTALGVIRAAWEAGKADPRDRDRDETLFPGCPAHRLGVEGAGDRRDARAR